MLKVRALGALSKPDLDLLAGALRARGVALEHQGLEGLVVDERIAECDVLLLTSPHLCLVNAGYLARGLGVRVLPDPDALRVVGHKLEMLLEARRLGLRTPDFKLGEREAVVASLALEDWPALGCPLRRADVRWAPLEVGGGDDALLLALLHARGTWERIHFMGERCWGAQGEEVSADGRRLWSAWRFGTQSPFGRVELLRPPDGDPPLFVDAGLELPPLSAAGALSGLVALSLGEEAPGRLPQPSRPR